MALGASVERLCVCILVYSLKRGDTKKAKKENTLVSIFRFSLTTLTLSYGQTPARETVPPLVDPLLHLDSRSSFCVAFSLLSLHVARSTTLCA